MNYRERLDELNRELLGSGASLDTIRDLFSMQLQTERMRVLSCILSLGEEASKQFRDLQADAELHQELVDMGAQEPQSAQALKEKLESIKEWLENAKKGLSKELLGLEAKLEIVEDPGFLPQLQNGDLGEDLDAAFSVYAAVHLSASSVKLLESES